MAKVKITVVKRLDFNEIYGGADVGCTVNIAPICDQFAEGQDFVLESAGVPEGFCPAAFADIFPTVARLRRNQTFFRLSAHFPLTCTKIWIRSGQKKLYYLTSFGHSL